MCGINGIYNYDRSMDGKSIIEKMNSKIAHRGPDAVGSFHQGGVHLGHQRLAIIDLDEHSNQPFYSSDRRLVMVYNGEVYNYLSLKEELKDYPFQTSSDTEVILAAYQNALSVSTACLLLPFMILKKKK